MSPRTLIGLSVGSGLDGVGAALVRGPGVGLEFAPKVERTVRAAFPAEVRDALRQQFTGTSPTLTPPDLPKRIAEAAVVAVRQLVTQTGTTLRDVQTVGLLEPRGIDAGWPGVADRLAEQTGLTVVHGFRGRDAAAGGSGEPVTGAADFLLMRDPKEDRLLVHLGAAVSVLGLPAGGKVSAIAGFDAGPGTRLLDAIVYHGTRGKEHSDPGGTKAVQGCCLEPLLARWREHPYFARRPPKALAFDAFGRQFLLDAFETARQLGGSLHDLLCTATHLVARSAADACRRWLPAGGKVYLSGGGVRNGFLWKLCAQQFGEERVARLDDLGVPVVGRAAAGAAVLAALTLDGVPGNLSLLTGAAGGRLTGHVTPGEIRNWARCAVWMAEQVGEYTRFPRAA